MTAGDTSLLPPPVDLAAEVRVGSVKAVATKYGVNAGTVRDRLEGAGFEVGGTRRLIVPDGELAPSWPDAECAQSDPELFFPDGMREVGGLAAARQKARAARQVCLVCPEFFRCAAAALERKEGDGVWGGFWFNNGNALAIEPAYTPRPKPTKPTKPKPVVVPEAVKPETPPQQPQKPVRHGTRHTYQKRRCRCADCTEANRRHEAMLRARRRAAPMAPDDPRHGRASTYVNWGCRCEPCTDANSAEYATQRARRRARGLADDDPRHGKAATYRNWGCMCGPCKVAGVEDALSRQRAS